MFLIDDTKDSDATYKPKIESTPKANKKSLNDNEFIRMIGAIQKGDFTIKTAQKDYALTEKQLNELKSL